MEFDSGVTNGVLSYSIHMLAPNTTYEFMIRGGNGCKPGEWGNKMQIKTTHSAQGGISFYKNFASRILSYFPRNIIDAGSGAYTPQDSATSLNKCQSYTVKPGDNLWNIAEQNLGSGPKYVEIMQKNNLPSTLLQIGC